MLAVDVTTLVEYTEWERQKWQPWFQEHQEALGVHCGPNGDGRFVLVGDVIKHIFSAEKRYVERLQGQPLSDFSSMPNTVESLFELGRLTREELSGLVETFPEQEWDVPREFKILTYSIKATPKKIALHILMHEIRHWAQIATLLRLNGFKLEFHDFLFSPVLDAK